MSKQYRLEAGVLAVVMLSKIMVGLPAWAQDITEFQNGYLTFTNGNPSLYYRVEFKPNLTDPVGWDGAFKGLRNIQSSEAEVTVPVGMFYRIVGRDTPWVAGTASANDILSNKTAYVNDEEITGSMPNQGGRGFMPGVANVAIPAGYYNGTGVVNGDAALVTGNIRVGVTVFGVVGKTEVVDTEGATATDGDILSSKTAYADGVLRTGSIPTRTLANTTTVVRVGHYAATNLVEVDADLAATNIKKDVNIFGITGNFEAGGNAYPALVPKTGQTESLRSGDDGDLEPGVAWPSPRFTIDTANWTVTDNLTGLMWRRIANLSGDVPWNTAIDNCNALNEYGYSDWRLPTLKEMMSLIDVRYLQPALCDTIGTAQWTSPNPFYSVQPSGKYWTSTSRAGLSQYKWYVDMHFGIPGYASGSINYYYVWPVRDAD